MVNGKAQGEKGNGQSKSAKRLRARRRMLKGEPKELSGRDHRLGEAIRGAGERRLGGDRPTPRSKGNFYTGDISFLVSPFNKEKGHFTRRFIA